MKMQTVVYAFLSGMGKASGHPVKWPMVVSMCWLPDAQTLRSNTRSMAILSKGLSGISVIWSGYTCVLAFSLLHNSQLFDVFVDVLIHAFPVILMSANMIGSIDSLVSQFVMGFYEYCKMPGIGDDYCQKSLVWIHHMLLDETFNVCECVYVLWGTLPLSNLLEICVQRDLFSAYALYNVLSIFCERQRCVYHVIGWCRYRICRCGIGNITHFAVVVGGRAIRG